MKLIRLFILLLWNDWSGNHLVLTADTYWNAFATNILYNKVKLVTELEDYFSPIYFSLGTPLIHVRMECSQYCVRNTSCYAFNVYSTESSYVCELLPTNFCRNGTRKALVNWPGNQVWEKLSTGMSQSCLETRYSLLSNIACEFLRPGCNGTWPNCDFCFRTCRECSQSGLSGQYDCTLWPESHTGMPIFAKCVGYKTYLIKRVVNYPTGSLNTGYQMSFYDMNRIYRLNYYKLLEFHFFTQTKIHHSVSYKNTYVDSQGILSNLTYNWATPPFNMFNLTGTVPASIPFVQIQDDRYRCGSFWLLDPSNTTYCPGGPVTMFGPIVKNANGLVSTGLSYPTISSSEFIVYATMELA